MNEKRCKTLRRIALFDCQSEPTTYNDDLPAVERPRGLRVRAAQALVRLLRLQPVERRLRITRRVSPGCFRASYLNLKKDHRNGRV